MSWSDRTKVIAQRQVLSKMEDARNRKDRKDYEVWALVYHSLTGIKYELSEDFGVKHIR